MVYAQPTAKDKSAQHTSHDITYNILLHISRQRTYSKHNQVIINNNNRISIQRTNISWFISEWTFTFLSFIAGLKNCLTVNETSIRKRLIRWFRNQFPPSFPVLHCTLGQGELQACLFPDVVFPRQHSNYSRFKQSKQTKKDLKKTLIIPGSQHRCPWFLRPQSPTAGIRRKQCASRCEWERRIDSTTGTQDGPHGRRLKKDKQVWPTNQYHTVETYQYVNTQPLSDSVRWPGRVACTQQRQHLLCLHALVLPWVLVGVDLLLLLLCFFQLNWAN